MNILYLADPYSIHDIKWIITLAKTNHCWVVYRNSKQFKNELLEEHGVMDAGKIKDFSLPRLYNTLYSAYKIRKIIKSNKIDLFHIIYAEPNALWAIFAKWFNIKITLTTRGSDVLKTIPAHFNKKDPINRYVKFFYKRAFKNFDFIISTSQQQIEYLRRNFNYPIAKTKIIRTGINLQAIKADTSNYLPDKLLDKQYIIFPRYMRPIYNHEFELMAINKLPKNITQNFSFVFLDEDSIDQKYVQKIKFLSSKIHAVNIIFLPKQKPNSLYEIYKKASLAIMTPTSDGSPVSAMEAMYCKIPLILGPLNYDEDIFGSWVYKLTKWDSSELARKIAYLIENRNSSNLDKAAQVVELYGNSITEMNRVKEIYKSLIGGNNRHLINK